MKVKAAKDVVVDGKKQRVITFDDGSSLVVDPKSKDAAKYAVGATKPSAKASSSAPMTTNVPSSSNVSHPSISTSGSVPAAAAAPSEGGGGGNKLPGILAGAGVFGVAAVGGGYTLMRRRA